MKIRGREVSEETIVEALKAHIGFEEPKEYPTVAKATCDGEPRLIINLTESMLSRIRSSKYIKQIVIHEKGCVFNSRTDYSIESKYHDIEPIFGTIKDKKCDPTEA